MKTTYKGTSDEQVRWGSCDDPRGILVEGEGYEVLYAEPHTWHTKIILKEYPDMKFNSTSFDLEVGSFITEEELYEELNRIR